MSSELLPALASQKSQFGNESPILELGIIWETLDVRIAHVYLYVYNHSFRISSIYIHIYIPIYVNQRHLTNYRSLYHHGHPIL